MKRFKISPQLCFLFICFILLHLVYVQTVIPPQIGWWNYYGWRMNSGEILYKDIFCFLPPGYVYIMSFLYKIFGNFLFGYQIVGMILRWIEVYIVYSVVNTFTSSNVSFLCTFAGLVLEVSYLMDIPFDCNQLFGFYIILSSFFVTKALLSKKERTSNVNLIISGVCLGIGLVSKQTCIVIIFFAVLGIMIFYLQYREIRYMVQKVMIFISGIAIVVLPVIILLLVQNSLGDLFRCLSSSMTVKGDFGGFFGRVIQYQFHFLEVVISILLFVFIFVHEKYGKVTRSNIFQPYTKMIMREIYYLILFLLVFYRGCQIIETSTGGVISYAIVINGVLMYMAIRVMLIYLGKRTARIKGGVYLEYSKKCYPLL